MNNGLDDEICSSEEELMVESGKEKSCGSHQLAKRAKYSWAVKEEEAAYKPVGEISESLYDQSNNIQNGEIAVSDAPEDLMLQVNSKNPFLQIPILDVLFSNMDFDTLKSARLVCHLWKNMSTPAFRKKSAASIVQVDICNHVCSARHLNGDICSDFLNTMENREEEEPPFSGLNIIHIDMDSARKMTKIFSLYGSYLTSLVIHFRRNDDEDVSGFFFRPVDLKRIIFYWCENLKTLELKHLPFGVSEMNEDFFAIEDEKSRKPHSSGFASSLTCLKWTDTRAYQSIAENFVVILFKSMPLLKNVEIDFEDDEAFDSFMHGLSTANQMAYTENLKSLKVGHGFGCIFYATHLEKLIAMNFKFLDVEIKMLGEDLPVWRLYNIWRQYPNFGIKVADKFIFQGPNVTILNSIEESEA